MTTENFTSDDLLQAMDDLDRSRRALDERDLALQRRESEIEARLEATADQTASLVRLREEYGLKLADLEEKLRLAGKFAEAEFQRGLHLNSQDVKDFKAGANEAISELRNKVAVLEGKAIDARTQLRVEEGKCEASTNRVAMLTKELAKRDTYNCRIMDEREKLVANNATLARQNTDLVRANASMDRTIAELQAALRVKAGGRRCWKRLLLALMLCAVALPARAALDLSGLPAHPRFFISSALRDTILSEIAVVGSREKTMFQEIRRRAAPYALVGNTADDTATEICNLYIVSWIDSDSSYAAAYKTKAIELLMYEMGNGWNSSNGPYFDLAYDWLYNDLTAEQREVCRDSLIAHTENVATWQRLLFYNLGANHAWWAGRVGLAIYGDTLSTQDSTAQDWVDWCNDQMIGQGDFAPPEVPNYNQISEGGILPARQYYMPDGGYYKGWSYGGKDLNSIVEYLLIMDRLGLGSNWDLVDTYLENIPEWFLRQLRPDADPGKIGSGEVNTLYRGYFWSFGEREAEALGILANCRKNPIANWINSQWEFPYSKSSGAAWWKYPLLIRPANVTTTPDDLPLYRFYGEQGPKPNTTGSWHERVVTRTDWSMSADSADYNDYDSVWFQLTAGIWWGDLSNRWEPTYEIYCLGALAIRAGAYSGGDDYYSTSASTNSVVVFDSTQVANDRMGTDYLWSSPAQPEDIYHIRDDSTKYWTSDIQVFETLDALDDGGTRYYARARANENAMWYNTNDERRQITSYYREFFWTAGNFVIADHIACDPESTYPKKFRCNIHTIEQPQMSTPVVYENFPVGMVRYVMGPWYTQRNNLEFDGRMTVNPLLPVGSELRRIGGVGYQCWAEDTWTTGRNIGNGAYGDNYKNRAEIGQWSVQIIPPGEPSEVDFLYTIYAGKKTDAVPASKAMEGTGMVGCELGTVAVVAFRRGTDPIYYSTSDDNATVPHYVFGLPASTIYSIVENGEAVADTTSALGTLFFYRSGTGGISINEGATETGSCCYQIGTCEVTEEAACSGTWTALGSCDPNPCTQPTGACCAVGGACSMQTLANCQPPNYWWGANVPCASVICSVCD